MFYGGEVYGCVIGPQAALDYIEHPMEAILNSSVIADEGSDQAGGEKQRGNVEVHLPFDLAMDLAFALHHNDAVEARPLVALLGQPTSWMTVMSLASTRP